MSDTMMRQAAGKQPMVGNPAPVVERWLAVVIMAASLLALAAIPGAGGLGAAAVMWIVAFAIFEALRQRPTLVRDAVEHGVVIES